jgi:glycerol uptake facilitator-like aquaporin
LFALNISGAHFNPTITLAQMFRKNSAFGKRRLKGIIYLLGQLAGSVLGAFGIWFLSLGSGEKIQLVPTQTFLKLEGTGVFQSIISETFGTFIFVLFFMISTDKKT